MFLILHGLGMFVADMFKSRRRLGAENLFLRHQLNIALRRALVRDNDRAYGHVFTSRVRAMGIRDRPISPGSPWQNGIAERLIGTLRRECLDQMVICGEAHLRRILAAYAAYYNQARTTWHCRKTRRYAERSNGLAPL
jgi:transposase InsO family protein